MEEVADTEAALGNLPLEEENSDMATFARERLAYSTSKRFTGFWLMLIVVGLVWLFLLKSNFEDATSTFTLEDAQKRIETNLSYYQDKVDHYTSMPDDFVEGSYTKQHLVEMYGELLAEWKARAEDPEGYRSSVNFRNRVDGISGTIFSLVMLGVCFLYWWSSRVPQFVVDRRRTELAVAAGGRKFITSFFLGLLAAGFSMEMFQTWRTKWSDGSTTDSTEINPAFLMMLFLIAILLLLMVLVMIYVLPLMVLFNLYRNRKYLFSDATLAKIAFLDKIPLLGRIGA